MERVAGIVAHLFITEHKRSVVNTHRDSGTLTLESAHYVDQALIEMGRLFEIAVGEHVADSCMDKMSAGGIFAGQSGDIVVDTGAERACAESQTVVRIRHGVKKRPDVCIAGYDSRQAENRPWERRLGAGRWSPAR